MTPFHAHRTPKYQEYFAQYTLQTLLQAHYCLQFSLLIHTIYAVHDKRHRMPLVRKRRAVRLLTPNQPPKLVELDLNSPQIHKTEPRTR